MTLETGVKALAEAVAVDVKALEDGKVDKELGKGLSTEDYTSLEKTKLAGIQAGAQVNAVTSVSGRTGAVTLAKGDVGLSNVDNTSDINKPISTAASSALSGKVDKVTGKGLSESDYTAAEKTKLAGIATEATKNRADSLNADKVHTHTASQVTGLGTAATYDVGEATGQVMQVGAFGVGHTFTGEIFDANEIADLADNKSGFYPYVSNTGSTNVPYLFVYIQQLFHEDGNLTQIAYGYNIPVVWVRHRYEGVWSPWAKQLSTNDILQTTGTSTEFPMSQASTTNQLAAKAPLSHTHPWSQVTGAPAQATRWPTFAEVTDKPVAQTVGTSTTSLMSQAAVTSQLDTKAALRAASNIDGGVRMRLDGTTLYITNDGSDA